jgi:UDP-galactopyranose mutase
MKKNNGLFLIIGSGIVGITLAERLAAKNKKVLIIEKRKTIGGNCFDCFNDGNYIQEYGPHIFHTDYDDVWKYLSRFTKWHKYEHKVLGKVKNKLIPIPFNFNSIDLIYDVKKAEEIKKIIAIEYGKNKKIPILELRKNKNKEIKNLADFVYENIFLHYTIKQWDLKPEEIDPSVTARVPIFSGYDDRYFYDKHQGIPKKGFTEMFKKMLKNKNIELKLGIDYKNIIKKINYKKLFYTGPLDYFFDYKFGKIKYRRTNLKRKKYFKSSFQEAGVINYPTKKEKFTRITEFNKFLNIANKSTEIAKEFPSWLKGFQAYPFQNEENNLTIDKYKKEASKLKNVYFAGRLAECKYYNMDQAVKRALELTRNL